MSVEKTIRNDQAYHARGVIARINPVGEIGLSGLTTSKIYEFITLDTGKGNPAQCVRFVGKAPMLITEDGEQQLDMAMLKEGDIVVSPGLLYRKTEFTGAVHAEHLIQLQKYRPKDIIIADAPDASEEAVDLGAFNLAEDTDTKHVVQKEIDNQKQ